MQVLPALLSGLGPSPKETKKGRLLARRPQGHRPTAGSLAPGQGQRAPAGPGRDTEAASQAEPGWWGLREPDCRAAGYPPSPRP